MTDYVLACRKSTFSGFHIPALTSTTLLPCWSLNGGVDNSLCRQTGSVLDESVMRTNSVISISAMPVVIRMLPVKWEDMLKVFGVRPADHLQESPQNADCAAHVEVSGAE